MTGIDASDMDYTPYIYIAITESISYKPTYILRDEYFFYNTSYNIHFFKHINNSIKCSFLHYNIQYNNI